MLDSILAEFTGRWRRGEGPRVEDYLTRLGTGRPDDAVELIYAEYCLAESSGLDPDPIDYLDRFPQHRDHLARLFGLHDAMDSSWLRSCAEPAALPEAGDQIGPYRLLRELGRGGFARVFLAEQGDLEDRLVVVKVAGRPSAEPRLLARARHPHIVEVLWHGTADGGALHLVCMPFLGGATLADVLAERRRPGQPRSPGLLDDLDRVAAPEYGASGPAHPAREVLAGRAYPRGIAWVVARLAEALDHAYRRGVTHGDLKPSNVLLTADGSPMLLDFNLAVDWRADAPSGDVGGTVAYMAPERLRAFAEPGGPAPRPAQRHQADLYALGLLLREALTDESPTVPDPRGLPPRDLAASLATRREQPWRWDRADRRGIPSGLRPIVARCLAPDPADRYARAAELAEDLDRWRNDRPLAFADEPSAARLLRLVRRRRQALAAGAAVLVVGLVAALAASRALQATLHDQATAKLASIWNHAEPGVFRFHRYGRWREDAPEDPAETARRHLARYDVLGLDAWRLRDDVRALSPGDRDDLDAWLLEQALRLARALADRPDAPADWRQALRALERAGGPRPPAAIAARARALRDRLGLPGPPATSRSPAPRWLDEYLLGVEAEPLRAAQALRHYRNALAARPGGFWSHYRAAVVAFRLGEFAAAAADLAACLARQPDNPALRTQRAGCLDKMGRIGEALEECDRALALLPDFTEALRTRALVRGRLGHREELEADLERFGRLSRSRDEIPTLRLRLEGRELAGETASPRAGFPGDWVRQLRASDVAKADAHALAAWWFEKEDQAEAALVANDQALSVSPDHLLAQFQRARLLHDKDREASVREFSALLAHPRFEELLQQTPTALRAFHLVSEDHLRHARIGPALEVARRGLDQANRLGDLRGESHYALARASAVAVTSDPGLRAAALFHFDKARRRNPVFLDWLARDRLIPEADWYLERLRGPSSPR